MSTKFSTTKPVMAAVGDAAAMIETIHDARKTTPTITPAAGVPSRFGVRDLEG